MVLFGGTNGTSYLSDTWQWSAVAVTPSAPSPGRWQEAQSVTITGTGFNGVTAVKFGGDLGHSHGGLTHRDHRHLAGRDQPARSTSR